MQRGLVKLFEFPAGAGFPAFLSLTWFEGGGGADRHRSVHTSRGLRNVRRNGGSIFHGSCPKGFFPYANGGNLAILYCFVFFYLVFAGPGQSALTRYYGKRAKLSIVLVT